MKRDKITSIALCAVLVCYMAFPVTSFVKPEKAEAVAPVAVAAATIFGTALAASGVYVAGTTLTGYDANLGALYDGFANARDSWSNTWAQYVDAEGSFDAAMQTSLDSEGNISLITLEEAGFFDSVESYTVYCVDNGTMATGTTSLDVMHDAFTFNGVNWPTFSGLPPAMASMSAGYNQLYGEGYRPVLYDYRSDNNYHYLYMCKSTTVYAHDINGGFRLYNDDYDWGRLQGAGGTDGRTYRSDSRHFRDVTDSAAYYNYYVCADITYIYNGSEAAPVSAAGSEVAVVDTAAQATFDPMAVDMVEPMTPTEAMLQEGITTASVIEAYTGEIAEATGDIATDLGSVLTALTTTISGTLNDIKTGVNGLENVIGSAVSAGASTVVTGVGEAVGALGDVVGDISTTLDNVWGGAQGWWADVLAWLGATPLAQLIAQIIAAINAGVLTLDAAIAAVQEWIGTAVLDIVGAIEAIQIPTIPELEMPPFLDLEPYDGGNADGTASIQGFSAVLRQKAPFAYMFAFVDGLSSVSGYTDTPNFRVEHTFEIFDQEYPFVIDAEPYLLYDLGGVTPAFLLRMSFSLSLCMGVLYASYRLGLKAVQGGE